MKLSQISLMVGASVFRLPLPLQLSSRELVATAPGFANAFSSAGWRRNVALNVFKYKTAADETSAWGDQKILHHFEPGRENLSVVSGIGSEAYLQVVPDRKDFEGTIWVHKNLSHFRLISVSEQSPSPDVLKAAAQKMAAKIP